MAWLFQGRADRWVMDDYLQAAVKQKKEALFTVKRYEKNIKLGEDAFIWRAGRDQGVVAFGKISREATKKGDILNPLTVPNLKDPYGETDKTLKVGVILSEVRIKKEEGFLESEDFKKHPTLGDHDVVNPKERRWGVFSMSPDQAEDLKSMLLRKWRTKGNKVVIQDADESNENSFNDFFKKSSSDLNTLPPSKVSSSEYTKTYEHKEIQKSLKEYLEKHLGKENVRCEYLLVDRYADVIAKKGESYDIYEIKTSKSARACIDDAIGQLLSYANYYPELRNSSSKLWVVGKYELDEKTEKYIDYLNEEYGIPLDYMEAP